MSSFQARASALDIWEAYNCVWIEKHLIDHSFVILMKLGFDLKEGRTN